MRQLRILLPPQFLLQLLLISKKKIKKAALLMGFWAKTQRNQFKKGAQTWTLSSKSALLASHNNPVSLWRVEGGAFAFLAVWGFKMQRIAAVELTLLAAAPPVAPPMLVMISWAWKVGFWITEAWRWNETGFSGHENIVICSWGWVGRENEKKRRLLLLIISLESSLIIFSFASNFYDC